MKELATLKARGHFFAAEYVESPLSGLPRLLKELFDATPLGIVWKALRSK